MLRHLRQNLVWLFAWLPWIPGAGTAADQHDALAKLSGSYEYLVSYRDPHGGALYLPREGPFKGLPLPYSFTDSAQYWGEYACKQPSVSCEVSDYYDASDYAVKPRPGEGALLQSERIDVHNGTNIYDAATWQIAVVLGSVVNHFGNPLDLDAYKLASSQNQVLGQVQSVRDIPTGSRATTVNALYIYNGSHITDPRSAYAFRMTAPVWLAPDPLKDSQYSKLIHVEGLPADNPRYQPGLVSWSDWKPVTGDNAWAFFVGPLQAAYIHFVLDLRGRFVPFEELPVQSALAALPAFAAMQSKCGAVYYAPAGTLSNAADTAISARFVSIENNLSLFAGLRILRATLTDELSRESSLRPDQKVLIGRDTALIDAMLSGGTLPGDRPTKGLREFLRSHAWHEGEFVLGGFADEPGAAEEWRAVPEPKAVDVNTWGVAALGSRQIDAWFGFGAAYRVWKSLKHWGAYGEGHTLWGVGYSDGDGNGQTSDGVFRSGVLSAEWTAGAIVMLRNMITYYGTPAPNAPDATRAREFRVDLSADERDLILGMQHLRFGDYAKEQLPGKPRDYANLIVEPTGPIRSEPYVYSSRRYRIPFGWYGNPLPSTSSTAWAILVADHYDPFGYGGKPN